MKPKVATPFFMVNPKSYLYGKELLKIALRADELAAEADASIFVTAPFADIKALNDATENIIVTAQHMDGIVPGRGMGHVLPESLYEAGARAAFLNHVERPLETAQLVKAMERADELGMLTIVCADSIKEAEAIAMLGPDILLCEPTELIGTGKTSDDSYITKTNEAVKAVNPNILMMQAAGISTAEDVYRTISLGAEGTGCTSGIVCAEDPVRTLEEMISALLRAKNERKITQ